jgi:amino acid adenylation domain-containing protein/non-ribosomal peptide synthase protein (TIGR01720 family)
MSSRSRAQLAHDVSFEECQLMSLSIQQRFAQRLIAAGGDGSVQVVVALTGLLDAARLSAASRDTSRDVSRATCGGAGEATAWSLCDLSAIPPGRRQDYGPLAMAAAMRVTSESAVLPGVTSESALLLRDSETEHALVLTCASDSADVTTLHLRAQEILDRYDGAPSREPGLRYADVVAWQEDLLREPEAHTGRRYWMKQQQACAFEPARLPFESEVRSARAPGTGSLRLELSDDIAAHPLARTPAFWIATLQALCYRLADGMRVVIGVVSDGRRFDELTHVIGPLDRTLPVPCVVSGTRSLAQSAAAIDALLHEHAAWQAYYDDAITPSAGSQASATSDTADTPRAVVPWHLGFASPASVALSARAPLIARVVRSNVAPTGAPIELIVHADGHAELRFDRRRFDAREIARLGRHLRTLAADAAAHPAAPLDTLSLLTPEARDRVVLTSNATGREWTGPAATHSITAWLDEQAARTPAAIAACDEDGAVTYAALQGHANQIARRLQRLHAGPESRVGVWAPRSTTMVAALVGILKAGAAYVPLDPAYPAARLAFQLTDARVCVVLTTTACAAAIPAGPYAIEVLDAPDDGGWRLESPAPMHTPVSPDQLAYVIYTSGSTGQPKGAMNTHRGLVNRLAWMQESYALTPHDRVLQKTSISFDVSVWELFWPLVTGATMVLARPGTQQDPADLAAAIARARVTVLHFVPALLDAFVAAAGLARCGTVRLIVSSGEALPAALAARCRAAWPGRLDNLYGPTEAAIDVTWQPCEGVRDDAASVPIGRPIANTQVYVRDHSGQPAPVGIIGELYLGGVQIGRGYLGRPDLTAERFLPDPFSASPGARLYRTGDLARYQADGAIAYIGRADHQVKLHGNRIELGEIEAALRRLAEVREAVVVLRQDEPGVSRLVAYIIPSVPGSAITNDRVQAQLREQLPEYMVPAAIVTLAAFPLTPNGKVDRRSLPAPSGERPLLTAAYAAPQTAIEIALARIWTAVLRVDRVGRHDNFFALGGDSIMSLSVVARAMQVGWRLSPRLIFEHPTIAALAQVATPRASPDADQVAVVGSVPLLPIQHWFFSDQRRAPQHYNQAVRVEIPATMTPRIDAAWLAIQRHHDALRCRFTHTDRGVIQTGTGIETAAPASVIDLGAVQPDAVARIDQRVVAAAQRTLDLARGPVARAIVLLADGRSPHVLFVIHHLVVDGVSWRILLADFQTTLEQVDRGEAPALPPKTTSLRVWATALTGADASGRDTFAAQRAFWLEATAPAATLPRDRAMPDADNTIRRSRTRTAALTLDETHALLHDLAARGATVPDILVAALVYALADWTRDRIWRIDLEGHGRDALAGDLDLSRTVGWFTSLYPVRITAAADVVSTWRAARHALRKVPLNGVGYGVLRYLRASGPDTDALRDDAAEILFNYLGQVDDLFDPAAAAGAAFRAGVGPTGAVRDPDGPREYLLEVNGIVVGRQLRLSWTYGPQFDPSTIERLADGVLAQLRILIASIATIATRAAAAIDEAMPPTGIPGVALDDDELSRMAQLLDQGTVQ